MTANPSAGRHPWSRLPANTRSASPSRIDAHIYKRGRIAALSGLVIQLALAAVVGLAGLWAESPAINAAMWHVLGGLPIWLVLALLYQQHETEQTERLAAESIESPGSTAMIFGDQGDDLIVARTRLERLYRYGLPVVSFLVATYLVVTGAVLLWLTPGGDIGRPALAARCEPVALLFVMGSSAFVAFVAARWISGYTKVDVWRLLRGGASYLMSTFVLAATLFAGALVAAVTRETGLFRWLAIAVPVFMILVGTEILLTSLLAAYRPRRPGEIPRPAFDSRVLGLLTAPESLGKMLGDLVNYQFGVEVSRSWLYQLLGRAVTPLTIFAAGILLALSTIVVVGPDEEGMLLRHGALTGRFLKPGVHFKLPWPMETDITLPVGRVHQIRISTDLTGREPSADAVLWTTDNDSSASFGQEYYLTAPSADLDGESRATGGLALAAADLDVQYRVADLRLFLQGSRDFKEAIRMVAQREANRFFGTHAIDTLLAANRTSMGDRLREGVQAEADRMGLGIDIVAVAVTALQPPRGKVSRAFHQQIGAVQERETRIQEAKTDAIVMLTEVAGSVDRAQRINEAIMMLDTDRQAAAPVEKIAAGEAQVDDLLSAARGTAAQMVNDARAYRWKRAIGEGASSDRFTGELVAYQIAPSYYRSRKLLDVLSSGLAKRRKFVVTGNAGDVPVLQMDFNDPTSALDTLLAE